MLAKNMTALGKLLMPLLLVSTVNAQTWDKPIYQPEMQSNNIGSLMMNTYRHIFSRMNKEEATKHQQTVFIALNQLDNGETARWYSNDGYSMGEVTVIVTAMHNGEICRRLYSHVALKSYDRSFQEWACYKTNTNTWNFSDK